MSESQKTSVQPLGLATVAELLLQHFGHRGQAERLTGERDENFRFRTESGAEFVLKVALPAPTPEMEMLPDQIMLHVERTDPGIPIPRVCRTQSGQTHFSFVDAAGFNRHAMLYTYIAGTPLITSPRFSQQRTQCGQWLARLGKALRSFDHPFCHRRLIWDLRQFADVHALLVQMPDVAHRSFLEDFMAEFRQNVVPKLDAMRRQVVHNDFNARNIIVDSNTPEQVVGVIDFGDAVHTALVADVAVGVIGQLATAETAQESIGEFVAAYHAVEPLTSDELAILNWLIAARIVTNFTVVSWHRSQNPDEAHFAAFGPEFFAWRIELARQLAADPRSVLRLL